MLAGAGLRHHALRADALGEQRLSQRIVDLVGAGVREVLAFEPDLRAPARGEGVRESQGGRSAGPGLELAGQGLLEVGAVQVLTHALLQALHRRNERLGHIASTKRAETAALVRKPAGDGSL